MRNLNRLGGQWARARIVDISRLKALLHVNINILIRTLCLVFAFSYFTAMGTKMGEITLAANAVLLHLQHFLAYGLDGFAFAVEALAGSAYGARNRGAFRTAVRVTTIWALIVAGLFTILYVVLGTFIINVITGIEPVRLAAADYLIWVLISPVLSVWSYQLDGIFIGTTRPVEMRNGMVLSLLVYLLAIWLFIPLLGNHGLWLSLMIFMVTRAITLGLWYPRIERSMP
jgi:MATE family multidrug resistance protein